MSERPILFSSPMVRAILQGRKTQTRRVLKTQPIDIIPMTGAKLGIEWVGLMEKNPEPKGRIVRCRLGVPGDRLWVRENGWQRPERTQKMMRDGADTWERYYYDADISEADHEQFKEWGFKRRPSIHMPRWASRITLEVTGVIVQRLQDISRGDAMAEGCPFPNMARGDNPCKWYADLWDSINAQRAPWSSNPWVWAIDFKRIAA